MTCEYALVTGGSSGMGLEYVRQLAARGYNVIIVALRQDETDAVKAEMDHAYPHLDFLSIGMDLAAVGSADTLYSIIRELRPEAGIEVLVNNAGVICPKHFINMSDCETGRILLLHNYTMTRLCRLYLPSMLEKKKGYILNVSSLGAWFPYTFLTTYSSTKAYTHVFTNALRMECQGSGVNVSTIYFGAVDTPLLPISDRIRKPAKALHLMMEPDKAVRTALKMLFAGRSGKMPGFMNRFYYYFMRHLIPMSFIGWLTRKFTEKYELS